jgi:hypothetical protein
MASDGWTAWRGRNTLTFVDHELAGEEVPKLDDHSRFLRNPIKDRVFFPGAIAWFRKSFLILELGGEKTTSIIDNLHHFSPHSEEFDTTNKLEDMKDANKLDCVCTFLSALSYCFPLFAGTRSAEIFDAMSRQV